MHLKISINIVNCQSKVRVKIVGTKLVKSLVVLDHASDFYSLDIILKLCLSET